jgi:hypothetical protein
MAHTFIFFDRFMVKEVSEVSATGTDKDREGN